MAEHTAVPTLSQVSSHTEEYKEEPPRKRGIVSASRIRSVVSSRDIHTAYACLFLFTLSNSFAQFTQSVFTAYATSAFKSHSLLASAGVVSRVFSMVAYTMVPKCTDNIGRISPLVIGSLIMATVISDIMMAACHNVQTYVGANVFSGIGSNGYEMAIQVYIAETTNIVSRALWNVAADSVSSIITMYSGAEIGGRILDNWGTAWGWRWGYGMWAIINVALAVPFLSILYSWHRRAARTPDLEPLPRHTSVFEQMFHEYDVIGAIFFIAGWALVLVPISRAKGNSALWTSDNIAMICVGFFSLILFGLWSTPRSHRPSWLFAPKFPFIPWYTLKNRSVLAMFIINMFDFMSYGCFTIYFPTFLQVAVRTSASKATMIDNTLRIVFQVTAIVVGLLMRFWTPLCLKFGFGKRLFHTRWPIWIGIPLCALSIAIEIDFVQHPRRKAAVATYVISKAIYGVGRGMFQTSSQVAIQAAAKRNELAIATGIFYFAMSLGGAIGVAIAGSIWTNTLPDQLAANLPAGSAAAAKKIYGNIVAAKGYDPNSPIGLAIVKSYSHTYRIIAIIATCLQIPMLISMLFLHDVALDENEQIVHGGKRLALDKKSEKSDDEREKEKDEKVI